MTGTTPSRSGVSPSSSPRLPSPPPFTEVQIGPKSPSIGASINDLQLDASTKQDDGASRRIRPGTKAVDMARGPPLVPLHQLESPFQLQEYLKALYATLTRDESTNHIKPITKETALKLATPPFGGDTGETVDRNLWLYELCRFLVMGTGKLVVQFFADTPPCSSQTCPEMRASEWQYLCAVHEPPKSCCAIDYCNHTLDWAANVLTSTKHFPSRLALGGESSNVFQSMRQLTNIFRRVYRIYAHAWFQHREVFWTVEGTDGLYVLFKTVCDFYQLIPEDNYTIPPEAEGDREEFEETPVGTAAPDLSNRMQILAKDSGQLADQTEPTLTTSTGATTRRHKHTPSTGVPVSMIAEGHEEEDEPHSSQANSTTQSHPQTKSPHMPPKPLPTTSELAQGLGRLELPQADTLRASEDPTPTIASRDSNPLAFAGERQHSPDITGINRTATAVHGSSSDKEENRAVLSPSGGSYRVGGPDVLNAILGHMEDTDDTSAEQGNAETTISGHLDYDDDDDDEGEVGEEDPGEEDTGNETMEKIELPGPNKQSESADTKEGKGNEDDSDVDQDKSNYEKDADPKTDIASDVPAGIV